MSLRVDIFLHVGGSMHFEPVVNYEGGSPILFSDVDCDVLGYYTLTSWARKHGCNVTRMWYVIQGSSLFSICEIFADKEVLEMVSRCIRGSVVDVYCEGDFEDISQLSISDDSSNVSFSIGDSENEVDQLVELLYEDLEVKSDIKGKDKSTLVEYDPTCDHKVIDFTIGLSFEGPKQLHHAVQQYAILNGFNIRWKRSNREIQEALCEKGCPWRLYVSLLKKVNIFVVKHCSNVHNCTRSMSNRQATVEWLANEFVQGNLSLHGSTCKEVQQEIMSKYTMEVPLMKCYRSKWLADKIIDGTIEDHYKDLRSYLAALRKKFPDSNFVLKLDRSEYGMFDTFNRLYFCFKPLVDGFLAGCRRIVGFDGTFLKHKVGGILMTAVGRDGNDGMYPIACAVVEGENVHSWTWFLALLFKDLKVLDGVGSTFISDQQKGLVNSICNMAPYAEHRNCARHIYQNWKVKHRGLFMKSCFYKAVKSTNEVDFNTALKDMKFGRDGALGSLDAAEDFMKQGPQNFCKAFFQCSSKCGAVSNNICETFNSFILAARRRPIIQMLERMRKLIMVRHLEKSKLFGSTNDPVCPVIRKQIESMKISAGSYIVRPSLLDKYEVSRALDERERFVVDLANWTCICRYWDLHKIPCVHAMACIIFMKRQPEDYVDDCFKKSAYDSAYSFGLEPLEGQKFWPTDVGEPIKPPMYKKLLGRPKKNKRKKSKEEEPKNVGNISKNGVGMKCSTCGQWGHNKRTCKGKMSTAITDSEVVNSLELGTTSRVHMKRSCKICGGQGHNRRTCNVTEKQPTQSVQLTQDSNDDV